MKFHCQQTIRNCADPFHFFAVFFADMSPLWLCSTDYILGVNMSADRYPSICNVTFDTVLLYYWMQLSSARFPAAREKSTGA